MTTIADLIPEFQQTQMELAKTLDMYASCPSMHPVRLSYYDLEKMLTLTDRVAEFCQALCIIAPDNDTDVDIPFSLLADWKSIVKDIRRISILPC